MNAAVSLQPKPRLQIEDDLREYVRQRRAEWLAASDDERDGARLRYIRALDVFDSFVLRGKLPEEGPA